MKTTVTQVVLRWVESCRYFLLESKDSEIAIQEITESDDMFKLLSCMGVLTKFSNRNKNTPQRYKITIEHLGPFKEKLVDK